MFAMISVEGRVEASVSLGDVSSLVVLSHLGKRVAVGVQLPADVVPPHGEVLLDRAAYVRTVWRWLRHDFMERLRGALPV